jgi:hypothetical protein
MYYQNENRFLFLPLIQSEVFLRISAEYQKDDQKVDQKSRVNQPVERATLVSIVGKSVTTASNNVNAAASKIPSSHACRCSLYAVD